MRFSAGAKLIEFDLNIIHVLTLTRQHDRDAFDCGESSLDDYLKKFALQNQAIDYGRTFVAVPSANSKQILGYYTISSSAIDRVVLPEGHRKHLPRYPVPLVQIGRLAVDRQCGGRGLGEMLLMHALKRAERIANSEMGIRGVEVWALHDKAKAFYVRYGFIECVDNKHHLYYPMHLIRKMPTK